MQQLLSREMACLATEDHRGRWEAEMARVVQLGATVSPYDF
jgi:hypothetical protein